LAGLLQSPPLELVHETVDGNVRSSKISNRGRKEQAFRRSVRRRARDAWIRQRGSQFMRIVSPSSGWVKVPGVTHRRYPSTTSKPCETRVERTTNLHRRRQALESRRESYGIVNKILQLEMYRFHQQRVSQHERTALSSSSLRDAALVPTRKGKKERVFRRLQVRLSTLEPAKVYTSDY
jgi:hypothetical protein